MSGGNPTGVRDTFASIDRAPQVPREVIDLIASYVVAELEPKKIREAYPSLRHGAFVCRAWREAFQPRLCDVVRLENESQACRFLKSGLVERHPIKDLCLLSHGHEAAQNTTGPDKRVCRSCLDIVNTVRGLQMLRGLPCYLPWDEEVVDKLKNLKGLFFQVSDHLGGKSAGTPSRGGRVRWQGLQTLDISGNKSYQPLFHFAWALSTPKLTSLGLHDFDPVDDDGFDFDLALKPLLRENGANLEILTISVLNWDVRDFDFVSALRNNIHLCPKLKELDLRLVHAELPGHLEACKGLLAALPPITPIKCLRIWFMVESEHQIRSIVVIMKRIIQNANLPQLDSLCVRIVARGSFFKSSAFDVMRSSEEPLDNALIVSKVTSVIEGSLWDDLRTLCDSVAINCVVKSVLVSPYP